MLIWVCVCPPTAPPPPRRSIRADQEEAERLKAAIEDTRQQVHFFSCLRENLPQVAGGERHAKQGWHGAARHHLRLAIGFRACCCAIS